MKQTKIARFAWVPLIGALAVQIALTAPSLNTGDGTVQKMPEARQVIYATPLQENSQLAAGAAGPRVTYFDQEQLAIAESTDVEGTTGSTNAAGTASEADSAETKSATSPTATSENASGAAVEMGAEAAFLSAIEEADETPAILSQRPTTISMIAGTVQRRIVGAKLAHKQETQLLVQQLAEKRAQQRAQTLAGIVVNGKTITAKRATQLAAEKANFTEAIEYIDQRPIMASGCEIVSLTIALRSMGFDDLKPSELADKHLSPLYIGSPYGNGGGLPPSIVETANHYLKANGDKATAYDLTGTSYKDLCTLVQAGFPVLVWTTEAMTWPSVGSDWYQPEHCVVLYGIKDDKALVSDSLAGLVERDSKQFGAIYDAIGKRAAFIQPK